MSDSNYWKNYYQSLGSQREHQVPSQFAAFSLLDMLERGIEDVFEFGCGAGRDTLFFLRHGQRVVASDKCPKSVEITQNRCQKYDRFKVMQLDVDGDIENIFSDSLGKKAVYARFLLHSLTNEEIEKFIKQLAKNIKHDDVLYVEYRTSKDKHLPKVFNFHYRNYLNSDYVTEIAKKSGFKSIYHVEGYGFAKWKHDDAEVCRQIYTKDDKGN